MWLDNYIFVLSALHWTIEGNGDEQSRQRRYLLFTPSSQWGVFVTVAVPLHPETAVSVAWFFEASYYNVANATYFEPLLGDIETSSARRRRSAIETKNILTRRHFYTIIESMLEKYGHAGRPCLLRAICENATSHFLHNGVLGDLLHLALTPSASLQEDIEDCYYEAEYWGLENKCDYLTDMCPTSPLDFISVVFED
ncbi:uncharacterized protein LOC126967487 [Leptidea sinapis]|uniref:uncharacterized protein LOC126967487 n=1 Tax=Leptidea sinapis TaxID=189913 RepID=UPI0021319753|nr:uncharacterized protein LOC126967487 [Leptidea sinapis]